MGELNEKPQSKGKLSQVRKTPLIVGIVGGSGSGKTWLAGKLTQRLGPAACHLSLDSFYIDRSHLSAAQCSRVNFDNPAAIDWLLLEEVLRKWLRRARTSVPVYDFTTHSRKTTRAQLVSAQVLVLEGLWLFRRPSIRKLFGLRVFLDCPAPLRLRRRIQRDLNSRGRTRQSVQDQFRKMVQPMHRRYVAPQERWADWVIRKPADAGLLDQLVRRIEAFIGPLMPQLC
jgi:uridine kinase